MNVSYTENEPTENNHYNPCFWTAYWNESYYEKLRSGGKVGKARKQVIFALNLRADKIISTVTGNVFYEKGAGLAFISKEEASTFFIKMSDDGTSTHVWDRDPTDLLLDFENHFTVFEDCYKESLITTIKNRKITDIGTKLNLSYFILTQVIRNPNAWNGTIRDFERNGLSKYEMLGRLKTMFTTHDELMKALMPILSSRWVLHSTKTNRFPLTDCSVLVNGNVLMIPLTPDLLLEVHKGRLVSVEDICKHKLGIGFWKYRLFRKLSIQGACREIIFGNDDLLRNWQGTKIYRKRLNTLNNRMISSKITEQ